MNNLRFSIRKEPYSDSVLIYAACEFANETLILQSTLVRLDEGNQAAPIIKIPRKEADAVLTGLMDELWNMGIRPSDIGTAGHLAATQQHLNDMRRLVEKTLDVKL